MKTLRALPLASAGLFLWALASAGPALAGQSPKPQAPAVPAPDDDKDAEGKADDVKDEEPATAESKALKKQWEAKACPSVDVKYDAETDKSTHPVPEPPQGQAMVFVIRPTRFGQKIQTKLAVDGQWIGSNRANNYLHFAVDPGEHFVCSKAENTSVLAFKAEAGKTYYLQQKIKGGFMKARNQVVVLDDQEGQKGLAKCHPSVSAAKK